MAAKNHHRKKTVLRAAVARYRQARASLHAPASQRSRVGLDWMNFFIADVQTGFGTFTAFYLAHLGWTQSSVGVVLTVGGLAAVLSQIPGGALADAVTWKRGLVALGIVMIGAAALILALAPSFLMVLFASRTAGHDRRHHHAGDRRDQLRTRRPARDVGAHRAQLSLCRRRPRGDRGLDGIYRRLLFPRRHLHRRREPVHPRPDRARLSSVLPTSTMPRRATPRPAPTHATTRVLDLARNHKLVLFTGAIVLFQLADASMLPLVGEGLATTATEQSPIWMAGLIIVPQIVVAIFAPWVGYHSEKRGRRPLLLLGFALEPIRAALLAFSANYEILIVAQVLSGITGAVIGVLTIVVITDLTAGTGRFNLAQGAVGAASGLAASLSTLATGFYFQGFGRLSGFIVIAAVAAAATVVLWIFLAETKPPEYRD